MKFRCLLFVGCKSFEYLFFSSLGFLYSFRRNIFHIHSLQVNNPHFKGTLSRDFYLFWVKNVLKIVLNAFSRTQNTPRTSREENQMIFSKEEQTIVSYWRFFQDTKENLYISLMFSIDFHRLRFAIDFHPSDPQPNTLNYSPRELVE